MGKTFGCNCDKTVEVIRNRNKELQLILSVNMDDIELCADKKLDFFLAVIQIINEKWERCNCEVGAFINSTLYVLENNSQDFKSRNISIDRINNLYGIVEDNIWEQII